ncbi:MAG: ABC transporter ATP-binding protein, partial [Bacteroidales bacterium]|nr:ABC transporter ATP-binding protein [Bacteroidales bacterium]
GFLERDEGEVFFGEKNLNGVPAHKREVNTIFQRYALFPHYNVFDNVAYGLKVRHLPKAEIEERVHEILRLVNLEGFAKRPVSKLSGGQQQRVAIARALVNQPKVLLLDEPLSALDHKMRQDMQIELKEMHQKLGITFIYVTHDQEEALTLSDTIVVMNEGKIQQIGTPADIYNEPVNSFVADFIGESNILNGTMIEDRKVNFIGHDFECVDEGFGTNNPVDVVIRPEDIYIMNNTTSAQFTGKVTSCIFKGVHYEMLVDTDSGYELMIQDYNAFEPGSEVGMIIKPMDIQVMRKERLCNTVEGVMTDESHVEFLDGEFECGAKAGLEAGDEVTVQFGFDAVELWDHQEEGQIAGEVYSILYKGDHYHLTILTESRGFLYVDTQDIWDKGDLVGITVKPSEIKICHRNDN